ncbi:MULTISPECIES: (Fe-S)-binding protein [Bacillus]|uniref:Glycolate oxidase iron-sulfur subunit n=1 Tax=Bacillus glycinifermentans TaxID=1664069 RepID=A0AAJ3YV47_9BACI|nr:MULTISPECIES: (Fe-S)-binding protein [Bacillus]KKB73660.1 glycolate oxidase [Bacillus sp. TH008]MDU0072334.1 (Fe-S)-binding protein [Bacillus sp. IG6]MED8020127.1 (Fe-S)-binding protein [Bacillus glycinifermentans]QAT63812.1 (Fe-S)-binding protein [Bacillus glycinifermentans]WKB77688.1 (Fe-S)-binding protein [Bacillus glycinifermentans]
MTTSKEKKAIQQQFHERMDEEELLNCMRCGFCLPSCPTYIESGFQESHSPRGRIALMKAVADGVIEPDEDVERSLELCLGCRACEPVCPSGVNYGRLLEEARDIIQQNKKHRLPARMLRNAVFKGLFPHQNRVRALTGMLGIYQRSGLQSAVRKSGMLRMLPDHLAKMESVLPKVPDLKRLKSRPNLLPPIGKRRKRAAFFSGCLMDTLFLDTNMATIKLLRLSGCEIVIPEQQACCGALHGHSGEKEQAVGLAKRNIRAFENINADYIVTNAGGCGAFLKEYEHLLRDEPEWRERAKVFSQKLRDFSSVLLELDFGQNPLELPSQIVTYQDSCHLRNVMKTSAEPRKLLRGIKGAEYREMKHAESCCGSAGIYNIVESVMSMKILDAKMEAAKATKAATIVTANPGCLLQMKLGIEREGLGNEVRAVHLADLLLEAAGEPS